MSSRYMVAAAAMGMVCAAMVGKAPGAAIIGTLNVAGAAAATASPNSVDFYPLGPGGAITADAFTQTGSFVAVAGSAGTIVDFASLNPGALSIPSFISFAAAPNVEIDITGISPGVFTAAALSLPATAGQTATPAGSAYDMFNLTGTSSALSWSVIGTVENTTTLETSSLTGVFTMQFANMTMQQVEAVWANAAPNNTVSSSFSATFTAAAIPEPASLGLLALSGLGLLRRRRR